MASCVQPDKAARAPLSFNKYHVLRDQACIDAREAFLDRAVRRRVAA
jgi:hypothetical protein